MKSKVRQVAQQRYDLIDFLTKQRNAEQEYEIENDVLFTEGLEGGFVLRGMEFNVDGGAPIVNITQEEFSIMSPDGTLYRRLASEDQITVGTAEGMIATGTNYLEAEVYFEQTGSDSRVFWDPLTKAEFAQATDTVLNLNIRLISNSVGWTTGSAADKLIRVAIVVTNGGVVERIHDNYTNTILSGAPADPVFKQNLLYRLNDINNTGTTEETDRFAFGSPRTDKNIKSLKNALDALFTQFKDLIGDGKVIDLNTNDWFNQLPVNMYALAQDRSTSLEEGGDLLWVQSTSTLSWASALKIRVAGISAIATITAGNNTQMTADGDLLYINIDRDATGGYVAAMQKSDFSAWFGTHSKDKHLICFRAADGVHFRDGTKAPDGLPVQLGAGAVDVKSLGPIGCVFPFYDFNGALTFDTNYFAYCDGSTKTVTGIGSQTLPDLSGRYLVGFGTDGGGDIGTAGWSTSPVGNVNHRINIQHSHTINNHVHSMQSHTHTQGSLAAYLFFSTSGGNSLQYISGGNFIYNPIGLCGVSGSTGINLGSGSYPTVDVLGVTGGPSTANTGNQTAATGTNLQLSTTQSIQPRSVRFRYLMRIK